MTNARLRLLGIAVAVVIVAAVAATRYLSGGPPGQLMGDTTRAPSGQRVIVEVLNGSGVSGLARRVTFLLRDRGFDVVGWSNDPGGRRTETLVIDYTNRPEAAERMARVLGGAKIEAGKDTLERGLDLTVRLGSAYTPGREPFHP